MKRFLCYILIFFGITCVYGQNLVPNPDFESFTTCPQNLDDFPVDDWITPTPTTSDYFHTCGGNFVDVPDNIFGFQFSSTGNAYAGIIAYLGDAANYREYIQAQLNSPTIPGACYEINVTYSTADDTGYSDGLGVLISEGIPSDYIGQTPQLQKTTVVEDRTVWHTLSGNYVATGNETHITIGNFNFDDQTNFVPDETVLFETYSYFYIDLVSFEFTSNPNGIDVDLGDDLFVCENDFPITLTSNFPNATNVWNTGETGTSIEVVEAGTYYVQTSLDCSFGTDTVEIELGTSTEIEVSDEIICFGEDITITLDPSLGEYLWTGGVTGNVFTASEAGDYFVELTTPCGIILEEFIVEELQPIELNEQVDFNICETELPILIDYSQYDNGNNQFLWQDGSTDAFFTISTAGNYTLDVSNDCFSDAISFNVEVSQEFPNSFEFTDTIICPDELIIIDIGFENAEYLWQDGTTSSFYFVQEPGQYSVNVFNNCGNDFYEFNIVEQDLLESFEITDTIICQGVPKLIDVGIDNATYVWQDGSVESFFLVEEAGIYSFTISNDCSSQFYEFEVVEQNLLEIINFTDTIACENENKLIDIGIEEYEYLWQDGSTQSFFIAPGPGDYSVLVTSFCGQENFDFSIAEAEEISLNLGQDIELCPGDSVFLSSDNGLEISWSTGENESGIWVSDEGEVIGSVEGFCDVVFDTVNISFNGQSPQLNLPDSLLLCEGDTLNISAIDDPSGIAFEWSTGDNTNEISIIEGGSYIAGGINNCGMGVDSVYVSIGESLNDPNLNDTYEICEGDSLNLSIISGTGTVEWSTGIQDSFITIFDEGFYFVEIENSCTIKTDSFEINFLSNLSSFDLGDDKGICQGDSITLIAPEIQGSYLWNTGEITNSINVTEEGTYFLSISGVCNIVVDSLFILDLGSSPEIDLGPDVSFCSGDSINLSVDANEITSLLWSTGSTDEEIIINEQGTIIVFGTNGCGVSSDTISVTVIEELFEIDLGEDVQLCSGDSLELDIGNVSGNIQ